MGVYEVSNSIPEAKCFRWTAQQVKEKKVCVCEKTYVDPFTPSFSCASRVSPLYALSIYQECAREDNWFWIRSSGRCLVRSTRRKSSEHSFHCFGPRASFYHINPRKKTAHSA